MTDRRTTIRITPSRLLGGLVLVIFLVSLWANASGTREVLLTYDEMTLEQQAVVYASVGEGLDRASMKYIPIFLSNLGAQCVVIPDYEYVCEEPYRTIVSAGYSLDGLVRSAFLSVVLGGAAWLASKAFARRPRIRFDLGGPTGRP